MKNAASTRRRRITERGFPRQGTEGWFRFRQVAGVNAVPLHRNAGAGSERRPWHQTRAVACIRSFQLRQGRGWVVDRESAGSHRPQRPVNPERNYHSTTSCGRVLETFPGGGAVVGRGDQATKGVRWMSWRQEAMKDVGTCDKPRGAGNQALILGSPNGETRSVSAGHPYLNA